MKELFAIYRLQQIASRNYQQLDEPIKNALTTVTPELLRNIFYNSSRVKISSFKFEWVS